MTKRFVISSIIILSIFSINLSYASENKVFTTGQDWSNKMTVAEKLMAVLRPYMLFVRYGVPIRKTPAEYVARMDKIFLHNPFLKEEDVANIFASAVYVYEPETRSALDALEVEFLRVNVKDSDVLKPYLLIKKEDEIRTL